MPILKLFSCFGQMASVSQKQIALLLLTTANAVAPWPALYEYRFGDLDRILALIAYVATIVGINALMLVSILLTGKKLGKPIPSGVIAVGIVFALLSISAGAFVVLTSQSGGDALKLAYSNAPLSLIHPEPKRLMVELLRRREANSRAYGQAAANAKPLAPPLYSVESFKDERACREEQERLKRLTDFDFAYFGEQEEAGKEFRDKLVRIDPTSPFLKVADSLQAPAVEMRSLEQDWLSSVLTLYSSAANHAKEITVKNGNLNFASEGTRLEFTKLLANSSELYQKFQQRTQDSVKRQKTARVAADLTD